MNKKRILIIGAGLIGKSIGYLLKEKGYRILVTDLYLLPKQGLIW
ncbi:hypothetical protein [Orenia metallireducens]|nr:hypothetical protein [Orenia metallireducens]